ncbi:MAG: arylsulfatase [Saprospiraceae bacterium]|nr:arylsulfatase [Lewinella sp.]
MKRSYLPVVLAFLFFLPVWNDGISPEPHPFHSNDLNHPPGVTGKASLPGTKTGLPVTDRPNIVLIMVDDMGWSDIACYGGEIPTPNIDALATNGLRFTQFYNNARCCPTRASLMTGLYSHQAGIGQMSEDPYTDRIDRHNYGTFGYRGYLNRNSVTLAEVLRSNGYHTYMTGKWHLGMHGDDKKPLQRGFEKYYGTLAGASSYFRPQGGRCLYEGDAPLPPPEDPDYYTTDAYTDKAIGYLKAQDDDQPFFLYLAYNAPHWPLHAKEADIELFKDLYRIGWDSIRQQRRARQIEMGLIDPAWGLSVRDARARPWEQLSPGEKDSVAYRMAVYAAQVYAVDYNVGKLVNYLRTNGELDNTLIIFLADNGACAETYDELGSQDFSRINDPDFSGAVSYGIGWANASNTPFFEYKVKPYEGGMSTPLILHYPGLMDEQRGKITAAKGHITDIMPTLVDVSGNSYPTQFHNGQTIQPMAGTSLVPVMQTGSRSEKEYMFWEHQSYGAVRKGDWKAVVDLRGNTWELFDLKNDRTERRNLAWENPQLVSEMAAKWYEWATGHHVFPKQLRKENDGRK